MKKQSARRVLATINLPLGEVAVEDYKRLRVTVRSRKNVSDAQINDGSLVVTLDLTALAPAKRDAAKAALAKEIKNDIGWRAANPGLYVASKRPNQEVTV